MWSIPTFQEFLNELNRADSDAELNEAVSSANGKFYFRSNK